MRLRFVKKESMPNPVKSLGYIKWYSSRSPRPIKIPSNSTNTTVRRSAVDLEDLKPYWKSKKGHTSRDDPQFYYLHVFTQLYLGGCSFYTQNKLQSESFNHKKSL